MRTQPDYLARYDDMACSAAHDVIAAYSTSFSLASRLLSGRVRTDICNLYAMVRIADEIVDGTAHAAGVTDIATLIDDYKDRVLSAPAVRFHTDPVLHAYALTARRCNFQPEHVAAFFASMRHDVDHADYNAAEFDQYVYGSAEVIGLLCLAAFLAEHPVAAEKRERMEHGARALGAAFQKVNFLRDLGEDAHDLGRTYFPGVDCDHLTDDTKHALIQDIRADLGTARATIPLLPMSSRAGVLAATDLFSQLTDLIDATPASDLLTTRVSVPRPTKLAIAARAVATAARMKETA